MSADSVHLMVTSLSSERRAFLAQIVGIESDDATSICEEIRWLYRSKVRKGFRSSLHAAASATGLGKHVAPVTDEDYPMPSWAQLVKGLAHRLKVYDPGAELFENECYICDQIIISALQRMPPRKRREFFAAGLDAAAVVHDAPQKGRLKGPLRTAGALGAANAAGFSLYTSASAALATVAGLANITLPFAAYTVLSSMIAIFTGPLAWSALGGWAFWRATSPEWKKLTTAIIYLIQAREAARLPPP